MNQSEVNSFLLCLSHMATVPSNQQPAQAQPLHRHDNEVNPIYRLAESNDGHAHDEDGDAHAVLVAKATAMAVLFCATALCGSIPFLLNRCFKWTDNNTNARSATVVMCLLYFGGGVLLCTTFLHLLPEVQETVESLQECGTLPELTFPLAELLMCLGFFAMFLIEELIHAYIHSHQKSLEKERAAAAFERGHSVRHSYLVRRSYNGVRPNEELKKENENQTIGSSVQDPISNDIENQKYQLNEKNEKSQQSGIAIESTIPGMVSDQCSQDHYRSHDHHDHVHSHLPLDNGEDLIASSLRGLLIVLALSLHELFEGLAIGLEGSASTVWFMFAAVSAHKLVLAFCVGVELIVARTRILLSIVYILTFAIVSPIGIGIGLLISHQDTTASSIPSAILQGFACGTLLYVVFFEILSKNRAGLLAFLALFIGFGVMFGLQQIAAGHEHSHGGCSPDTSTDSHTISTRHEDKLNAETLEQQLQILRSASANLKDILRKS